MPILSGANLSPFWFTFRKKGWSIMATGPASMSWTIFEYVPLKAAPAQ